MSITVSGAVSGPGSNQIHYLKTYYPVLSLIIQINPAFCSPSLATEVMKKEIETITSIPVVSITCDGTGGLKKESVVPYLKFQLKVDKRQIGTGNNADRGKKKRNSFLSVCRPSGSVNLRMAKGANL